MNNHLLEIEADFRKNNYRANPDIIMLKVIRKIAMCENSWGHTDFNAAQAIRKLATYHHFNYNTYDF
mgnify:FL=1|jgi:hypothetical protein